MKIIGWIINAFGAVIMLVIFLLMAAFGIKWIIDHWHHVNTIPKMLKAIGRGIGYYILFMAFGAVIISILWIITSPPYPYNAFIGCFGGGVIIGIIYMVSKK